MENSKVFVEVLVKFGVRGGMTPVSFRWEDGKIYKIKQVKGSKPYTNKHSGMNGIMYTVLVDRQECHIYFEYDKWFMERKEE